MAFSTLAVDFTARMAGFEEGINKASRGVDQLNNRVSAAAAGIKSTFGTLGIGLGVGAFAALAKSGIDAADSMNDLSARTGVAVQTLAGYKLAADQSGTSLDALGLGIQKLTLSIGQAESGSKEQAAALKNLGITARDPQQAFEQLADAVAHSNDPIKTNANLQKLLGKNYAELLPLLQGGAQGLRDSAAASKTFAEQMAKLAPDADKFNDNLAKMKTNAAGVAATMINALVPALNNVFDRFDRLSKLDSATFFEKLTGQISADLPSSIANVNGKIKDLEADIERLTRNSTGQDSSILPLKQELARLKQLKAELRSVSLGEAMKLADAQYKKPPAGYGVPGTIQAAPDKAGKTRSVSDPLAPYLSQTDTARAAEYEKLLGLLEARFSSGKIKAGQYQETMAALNKQFGREMLDPLGSGSFKTTNKDVAAFIKDQQNSINELNGDISKEQRDAAQGELDRLNAMIANSDFGKLKKDQEDMIFLTRAFTDGIKDADGNLRKLSESEYIQITTSRLGLAKDKVGELDVFAKKAAENIQQSFSDFLFDPFDKGMSGMLKSFGQTIQRMIADAVAADLTKRLFGDLVQGGSGSGVAGGLLKSAGGLFDNGVGNGQNLFGDIASLFGFATGGAFTVGGGGGTDSQLVAFRATPGERVDIRTPGQMKDSGGHTIIVNVNGGNAPDVRRAAAQGAREALGFMSGAQRYA